MRIMPWETTLDQFASCWQELDDPRSGNAALHDFLELLMIAFCAVLCGGQGAVDMAIFAKAKESYLRGFLKLANGLPSHDTFNRLFRRLDPDQFGAVFERFMMKFFDAMSSCYRDRRESVAPFVRPSQRQIGLAHGQRLGLRATLGAGANRHRREIERDYRRTEAAGNVVAEGDNCDRRCAELPARAIAEQIVKQGGDYVLALKGNQGGLHDDVCCILMIPLATPARPNRPSMPIMAGSRRERPVFQPISPGCRKTINGLAFPPSAKLSESANPCENND